MDNKNYQKDLESIRQLMDRSVKFISLSGLSGILAGFYALIGAVFAYFTLQYPISITDYGATSIQDFSIILKLLTIAAVVLLASLSTGVFLTLKKSQRLGVKVNFRNTKRLAVNLLVPLAAGGIFIILVLSKGHYGIVAPACLIFYGLALINASPNLYEEVRYLGYCEIIVGLLATYYSGFGLLFWAVGFGLLHVVYGVVMYRKYDS